MQVVDTSIKYERHMYKYGRGTLKEFKKIAHGRHRTAWRDYLRTYGRNRPEPKPGYCGEMLL